MKHIFPTAMVATMALAFGMTAASAQLGAGVGATVGATTNPARGATGATVNAGTSTGSTVDAGATVRTPDTQEALGDVKRATRKSRTGATVGSQAEIRSEASSRPSPGGS